MHTTLQSLLRVWKVRTLRLLLRAGHYHLKEMHTLRLLLSSDNSVMSCGRLGPFFGMDAEAAAVAGAPPAHRSGCISTPTAT